jgi:hypothetical protein
VRRSYKFRLRPTKKQEAALNACLEDTRQLYNAALEERREAWRMGHHQVTFYGQSTESDRSRPPSHLPAVRPMRAHCGRQPRHPGGVPVSCVRPPGPRRRQCRHKHLEGRACPSGSAKRHLRSRSFQERRSHDAQVVVGPARPPFIWSKSPRSDLQPARRAVRCARRRRDHRRGSRPCPRPGWPRPRWLGSRRPRSR